MIDDKPIVLLYSAASEIFFRMFWQYFGDSFARLRNWMAIVVPIPPSSAAESSALPATQGKDQTENGCDSSANYHPDGFVAG